MKKEHKHIIEKKENSLKSGKGNKEYGPSKSPRDPSDRGDPRGSRQPRGEVVRTTDAIEKGDERRPYRNR